jgi:RNA-binding protein 39
MDRSRKSSYEAPAEEISTALVRVASPDDERYTLPFLTRSSFVGAPDSSITEIERNARTVFITQLAARVTSNDVAKFFSPAGQIRDIRIVHDKATGRSKGYPFSLIHI